MANPYYISPISYNREIFKKLKKGDLLDFSSAYSQDKIRKILVKHDIDYEYCKKGSKEYLEFGPRIFIVTDVRQKMKNPNFLGSSTNRVKFFNQLKVGDLIQYSIAYDVIDVKDICKKYNFSVEYCPPNSNEYIIFGSQIVRVIDVIPNKDIKDKIKLTVFDPAMLDI